MTTPSPRSPSGVDGVQPPSSLSVDINSHCLLIRRFTIGQIVKGAIRAHLVPSRSSPRPLTSTRARVRDRCVAKPPSRRRTSIFRRASRASLSRVFGRACETTRARAMASPTAAGFRSRRLAIFDALEARASVDASERETDDRCASFPFPRAQCLIASSNVRLARTHRSARSRRESPSAWMMTTPSPRSPSVVDGV